MSDALRDEFRKAVRGAMDSLAHFPVPPQTHYTSLWQVIGGPERSGKSVMALEYADALDLAGITSGPPRFLCGGSSSSAQYGQLFRDLKNGTLIIDEPEKLTDRDKTEIYRRLVEAYDAQSCVVVVTGYKPAVEGFIADMPAELKSRWKPKVQETTRSFTREECASFDAERKAAREAVARNAERQKQRAEEMQKWRELPEVDVSVPKTVTPLRTVKFGRTVKPGPITTK